MKVLWLGWEDDYTPKRVIEAANKHGVDLAVIDINDLSFTVAEGTVGVFYKNKDIVHDYDVLVARTFFPYISETLTIARLFHNAGSTVIDSSLTDEGFVVSKMHDYLLLAGSNLPVPRTWQSSNTETLLSEASRLGYPCVLKGVHGSHGIHVHLVGSEAEARIKLAQYQPGELMLQEYLSASEDFRLMVVGYRTMPFLVSRQPIPGDFRTNVGLGISTAAHQISDYHGLAEIAQNAARVLRREFAGVDIRYSNGVPIILEVNRRPIFENYERVTGFDVAGEFMQYITEKRKRDENRAS